MSGFKFKINPSLLTIRRVARIWKRGGGAFLKEWEKCKRPWSEFSLFLNQFHTVCPKIKTEFFGKLGNSKFFPPKIRWSPKKKKKVFTEIETDFSAEIGNSNVWGGLFSFGGGYFQFFTKDRPQKHQKRAILHTSQANVEGLSPPAPPWLHYCLQYALIRVSWNMKCISFGRAYFHSSGVMGICTAI